LERLNNALSPLELDHFLEHIKKKQLRLGSLLREQKLDKLAKLTSKKTILNVNVKYAPPVINLSQAVIPEEELKLLSKGPKFAAPSPRE